jgi:hypothetical protein
MTVAMFGPYSSCCGRSFVGFAILESPVLCRADRYRRRIEKIRSIRISGSYTGHEKTRRRFPLRAGRSESEEARQIPVWPPAKVSKIANSPEKALAVWLQSNRPRFKLAGFASPVARLVAQLRQPCHASYGRRGRVFFSGAALGAGTGFGARVGFAVDGEDSTWSTASPSPSIMSRRHASGRDTPSRSAQVLTCAN